MPGHPLSPIASRKFRGCRTSLLHQTHNLEVLVRIQASAERSMWCNGSTLSGLFGNCPYKNSRADGSRLLRPPKPESGGNVVTPALGRKVDRTDEMVYGCTPAQAGGRGSTPLDDISLAVIARKKNSGTAEATLLRIARPLRKERGGPDSISGGPAGASTWTLAQGLSVPHGTALFHQ